MRAALDIVAELRALSESGSKSDRHLAKMVLADPEFFMHGAIDKIAERSGVSEPTVTRFCRSLGVEGIREFRVRLAQALAVGTRFLQVADVDREATNGRVPDTIAAAAYGAIDVVCNSIDMVRLAEAADAITASTLIRTYGSGGSSSMAATELENRLFRLGLPVAASVDGEIQRMTASVANAQTAIVAFSISGHLRPVIDAVAIARQYGAKTIAFTAPKSDWPGRPSWCSRFTSTKAPMSIVRRPRATDCWRWSTCFRWWSPRNLDRRSSRACAASSTTST